jgi:hypothetical protein
MAEYNGIAAMKSTAFHALMTLVAIAGFAAPADSQSRIGSGMYRPDEMQIEDQPGYVPSRQEEELPAQFHRQMVFYRTNEAPGTIIVDTPSRYLYLVQGNSRAIRYGIGVGRDGFQWSGLLSISRKAEWPDWTPPPEMITRQPYLPRFMAGVPGNPLGAPFTSATLYIASMAPISPRRLGAPCHRGAFGLSTTTSSIFTTAFRLARGLSCASSTPFDISSSSQRDLTCSNPSRGRFVRGSA